MFIKFYVIGIKGTLDKKVCKYTKGGTNPINAKENMTNKHWTIYTVKLQIVVQGIIQQLWFLPTRGSSFIPQQNHTQCKQLST
jgi:hypothetical protein